MRILLALVLSLVASSSRVVTQDAPDIPRVEIAAIPSYPRLPSGGREEGEVEVEISITTSGEVATAKAVAGPDRLRLVAEKAAQQWRFYPLQQPVRSWRLTFVFFLKPGIGELPSVNASFKPPNRVELYAEPKTIELFQDPPARKGTKP